MTLGFPRASVHAPVHAARLSQDIAVTLGKRLLRSASVRPEHAGLRGAGGSGLSTAANPPGDGG